MMQTRFHVSGRQLDFDWFVHWRHFLWRKPVARALAHLGDLRGKRLLHVGDTPGRMTCLFALNGIKVTVVDPNSLTNARTLARELGCDHNVRFIQTTGGFAELGEERFDAVFIKSVLWEIPHLDTFLDELLSHLLPGAPAAFVDNNFNGSMLALAIRKIIRHPLHKRAPFYSGIKVRVRPNTGQIPEPADCGFGSQPSELAADMGRRRAGHR